jgi:hypothetical protein
MANWYKHRLRGEGYRTVGNNVVLNPYKILLNHTAKFKSVPAESKCDDCGLKIRTGSCVTQTAFKKLISSLHVCGTNLMIGTPTLYWDI